MNENLSTLIGDSKKKSTISKSLTVKNWYIKVKTRVFLAFLLALFLASQPRFCLVVPISLIVGLAIGGAKSMIKEIAIGLAELSQ